MLRMTHYRYLIPVVMGVVAGVCLVMAYTYYRTYLPFVPQVTSLGERPYTSVVELAAVADVVVRGSVAGIAGRQVDYGTQDAAQMARGGGAPVVFYAIVVAENLWGVTKPSIFVAGTDFRAVRVAGDHETPCGAARRFCSFSQGILPRRNRASRCTMCSMSPWVWTTACSMSGPMVRSHPASWIFSAVPHSHWRMCTHKCRTRNRHLYPVSAAQILRTQGS